MMIDDLRKRKNKEKIIMLTAYDYLMAKIIDESDIDLILVGDSLGMVVQGHKDTKSVVMEEILYHTRNVARATKRTGVIGDMPIYSDNTPEDALMNAKRIMEAGAHAIKIEGNKPEVIRTVLDAGIPIMGHLGLLPQTAENYRVKGKKPEEADRIFNDALELDQLGVFSMVIECIPESLARKITEAVKVPTIGAGAGKYCDGQNINMADILGMDDSWAPKFVKRYANLNKTIKEAIAVFKQEVLTDVYPDEEHTYH